MWRVTRTASFGLNRGVLVNEWPLLVRMTLNTSSIGSNRQSGLFEFKAAMRIVTVATLHGSFENFVMERQVKLMLRFAVTAHAKLRFSDFQ
jgi:hypothetical protein